MQSFLLSVGVFGTFGAGYLLSSLYSGDSVPEKTAARKAKSRYIRK